MARHRVAPPSGHGEVLTDPPYERWTELAEANRAAAEAWTFDVCGVPAARLRAMARREALEAGAEFSARLGVPVREVAAEPGLLAVTGHQPELYHPGVWVKDFLLQRFADETGASALDLIVDSDSFDAVEVHSPCLRPEVRVCRAYLALGTPDSCYGRASVPSKEEIETFCTAAAENLDTLPAPAVSHHFATFCGNLRTAAEDARNLAELVTFARRRYEATAGTDYLELPVSTLAATRAFATFLGHTALDALRFAEVYNGALASFRERTGTRSSVQPFPDLRVEGELVELPFWHLGSGRSTIWARTGQEPALVVDGEQVCRLGDCRTAPAEIGSSMLEPAPKALALTTFARMFVADLFVHGVGGARYDEVTDDVIRRWFGVEPPEYAVASMTMYLPIGVRMVRDEEIEAVTMSLNRLKHNPDQMLDEIEFESAEEHECAVVIARRKAGLVEAIAAPGADKKALGAEIRSANEELAAMLAPVERRMTEDLEELRRMQEAAGIMTDRTYPFCFWSPLEVADKVR